MAEFQINVSIARVSYGYGRIATSRYVTNGEFARLLVSYAHHLA